MHELNVSIPLDDTEPGLKAGCGSHGPIAVLLQSAAHATRWNRSVPENPPVDTAGLRDAETCAWLEGADEGFFPNAAPGSEGEDACWLQGADEGFIAAGPRSDMKGKS